MRSTPPATRRDLRRALVVNAATKPANVLVATSIALAGLVLAVPWLLLVAIVCWLALVVQTFFDDDEATRVGERARLSAPRAPLRPLSPEIAARLRAADAARTSIHRAVEESGLGLDDVALEVDALVLALQGHAARAQRIAEFRSDDAPDAVRERIRARLTRLLEEMDHVVSALRTLHAEILLADDLDGEEIVALRDRVQAAAAALEEAFA
ncbi:hypothetical protein OM076_10625 [Solirubrobacter ginsenosidimutans]|uniref:Uncharacterized protein n=1 Tax=Solirubrobacter ginsenosidimutans TaxID=490573 RepID=A0A9X3MQS7_9ACTN|nr:hypothetical protein [Solirubrobacter ginsenosidimutans]MDA0160720.1 hypothetical protein [Solirubrobacter ginsenosidimutans]